MIKKLLVVSLAALGIGLTGCLTDPLESTTPTITLGNIDTLTAGSGASRTVTGKIEGTEAITNVTYQVSNSAGASVSTITVTGPAFNSKKSLDLSVTVLALAGTASGTYTLKISATAGATGDGSFNFYVKGATIPVGTPVVTTTLTAGANKNAANGSSIDLDGGVAYRMADAAANLTKIDLCYAHAGTAAAGSDKLGTPVWAKASEYDFAIGWVTPPVTKFYKTTLTAAQFDAIDTKEKIPTFVDASAIASSVAVANDVFIVKTTEGATVLIKITAQTPGEAGTITIKSAK